VVRAREGSAELGVQRDWAGNIPKERERKGVGGHPRRAEGKQRKQVQLWFRNWKKALNNESRRLGVGREEEKKTKPIWTNYADFRG